MHNEEEEKKMEAIKMFQILAEDSQKVEKVLEEEIQVNGTNDDIESLKVELDNTYIIGNMEYMELSVGSFACVSPFGDKVKMAVPIIEYLCEIKSMARKIYKERKNSRTRKILNMALEMSTKIKVCIMYDLE